MIKNIVFDWSGVISDNTLNVYKSAMGVLASFGVDKISFDKFRDECELPVMRFYNRFVPNLTFDQQHKIYAAEYSKYPNPGPYEDIGRLIKQFKTQGIKMAILSSDPPRHLLSELKEFDLQDIFITIFYLFNF